MKPLHICSVRIVRLFPKAHRVAVVWSIKHRSLSRTLLRAKIQFQPKSVPAIILKIQKFEKMSKNGLPRAGIELVPCVEVVLKATALSIAPRVFNFFLLEFMEFVCFTHNYRMKGWKIIRILKLLSERNFGTSGVYTFPIWKNVSSMNQMCEILLAKRSKVWKFFCI